MDNKNTTLDQPGLSIRLYLELAKTSRYDFTKVTQPTEKIEPTSIFEHWIPMIQFNFLPKKINLNGGYQIINDFHLGFSHHTWDQGTKHHTDPIAKTEEGCEVAIYEKPEGGGLWRIRCDDVLIFKAAPIWSQNKHQSNHSKLAFREEHLELDIDSKRGERWEIIRQQVDQEGYYKELRFFIVTPKTLKIKTDNQLSYEAIIVTKENLEEKHVLYEQDSNNQRLTV